MRLTKNGWKAVSPVLGDTPKPTEETQNAPAAHFVMVSGTVFSTFTDPPSLNRQTSKSQVEKSSSRTEFALKLYEWKQECMLHTLIIMWQSVLIHDEIACGFGSRCGARGKLHPLGSLTSCRD